MPLKTMDSFSRLRGDHEGLFREILKFEDMINQADFDYNHIIVRFHRLLILLSQHKRDHDSIFKASAHENTISLSSRLIKGHIAVISKSLISNDPTHIRLALDNDGRMLASRIKEHVIIEEAIFDRISRLIY